MPIIRRIRGARDQLDIVSIASGAGWVAAYSGGETRHLVAWVLLKGGEVIGVVDHGGEFVSAENTADFSGFKHPN